MNDANFYELLNYYIQIFISKFLRSNPKITVIYLIHTVYTAHEFTSVSRPAQVRLHNRGACIPGGLSDEDDEHGESANIRSWMAFVRREASMPR